MKRLADSKDLDQTKQKMLGICVSSKFNAHNTYFIALPDSQCTTKF